MSHLSTVASLKDFRSGARGFHGEFHAASLGLQGVSSTVYPTGEINYFDLVGAVITIGAISDGQTNLVQVDPPTTLNTTGGMYFDNGGANDGTLRYQAVDGTPRVCQIVVTFNGLPANINDDIVFCLQVDGNLILNNRILWGGNSRNSNATLSYIGALAQGDTIRLLVGNMNAARDVTCHGLVISCHAL